MLAVISTWQVKPGMLDEAQGLFEEVEPPPHLVERWMLVDAERNEISVVLITDDDQATHAYTASDHGRDVAERRGRVAAGPPKRTVHRVQHVGAPEGAAEPTHALMTRWPLKPGTADEALQIWQTAGGGPATDSERWVLVDDSGMIVLALLPEEERAHRFKSTPRGKEVHQKLDQHLSGPVEQKVHRVHRRVKHK